MKKCGAVFFSRTTDDGDEHRFKKQQQHSRSNSGNSQTALAQQRSNDEVQGHKKADSFKGDAARSGGNGASGRKKFDSAMRQQQHAQSEKDAAGVEAPRQQNSGNENRIVREVNCGGGDGQKSARQQNHCGEQQYASWHEQGFQCSLTSNIHGEA